MKWTIILSLRIATINVHDGVISIVSGEGKYP